jgi:hypothetical protein
MSNLTNSITRSSYNLNTREAHLSNDQLMRIAPSIFATEPWNKMSARYAFIPTIQVVEKMRTEGFVPVAALQSRTRIDGKQDFTRHMIRFRDIRNGYMPAIRDLGSIYAELMLTNSHDGASAYKLDAALFREVCKNGMVVSDSTVSEISVRHSGSVDGIIDATYSVVEEFPKVLDSVEQFAQLRLNEGQRMAFATAALELRYDAGESPITPAQVLRTRRAEDAAPTLWNTLNAAQENLVGGGLRGQNTETKRRLKTRPVSGIAENTRLNKALWTLTEAMRKLVG